MKKNTVCDCDFCKLENANEIRKNTPHMSPNFTQDVNYIMQKKVSARIKREFREGGFYSLCSIQ